MWTYMTTGGASCNWYVHDLEFPPSKVGDPGGQGYKKDLRRELIALVLRAFWMYTTANVEEERRLFEAVALFAAEIYGQKRLFSVTFGDTASQPWLH